MVIDALRGYLQLASGLTDVTKERARQVARAVLAQAEQLGERPGDAGTQVRALADELATTARSNRDLLLGLVRAETERAVAALGLATTEDLDALRRRVERLERGEPASPAARTRTATPATTPAKTTTAKATTAKTPARTTARTAKTTTAKTTTAKTPQDPRQASSQPDPPDDDTQDHR